MHAVQQCTGSCCVITDITVFYILVKSMSEADAISEA